VPTDLNQSYLLKEQYHDASNFAARVRLSARFKTNPGNFHRWVFERLHLGPASRVLELGCGPGLFWPSNLDQIPADWDITLSDFSPGMLRDAERVLASRASGSVSRGSTRRRSPSRTTRSTP
jgi:hypothetical protein